MISPSPKSQFDRLGQPRFHRPRFPLYQLIRNISFSWVTQVSFRCLYLGAKPKTGKNAASAKAAHYLTNRG